MDQFPECPNQISNSSTNTETLKTAYENVAAMHDLLLDMDYDNAFKNFPGITAADFEVMRMMDHRNSQRIANIQSEYGLLVMARGIFNTLLNKQPWRFPNPPPNWMNRLAIGEYFEIHRFLKGNLRNESIDEPGDLFRSYCDMGEKRVSYLRKSIEELNPENFRFPSASDVEGYGALYKNAMRSRSLSDEGKMYFPEYRRHMVCDRNSRWVQKIHFSIDSKVKFYALGYAHVFKTNIDNNLSCNGLLVDFENLGYSVKLIK